MDADESSSPQNAETSTPQACAPRNFIHHALFLFLASALMAAAQESPTPQPPSPLVKPVRITFVPPPIEGTFSLGIYDATGKLVRVLHREAAIEAFEVGSDALVTSWDGKDDSGMQSPPGKYHARGCAVGELEIEGVGFFFNDWVTSEDSPRIERITAIAMHEGRLLLSAQLAGGQLGQFLCDRTGKVIAALTEFAQMRTCVRPPSWPESVAMIHCAPGQNDSLWVIDHPHADSPETEVKQYSAGMELLRRLATQPGELQPTQIAASQSDDYIFLLEEGAAIQLVRGLSLLATTAAAPDQAVSDWKVEFTRKIQAHKEFTIENGKPVVAGGKAPPEKVSIKLMPNPLEQAKAAKIDLAVGYDEKSSFLQTADGLPLETISETPNLKRIVLSPAGEKTLDVFQDDDAVVEQFRIGQLDQMMAFDCGEIELK